MSIGFYKVRPGDQLNRILIYHYGQSQFSNNKALITQEVLHFNPAIRDLDRIFPNQIIALPEIDFLNVCRMQPGGGMRTPPQPVRSPFARAAPQPPPASTPKVALPSQQGIAIRFSRMMSAKLSELEDDALQFYRSINWNEVYRDEAKTFLDYTRKLTEESVDDIKKAALQYYRKESGMITKGQYDYRKAKYVARVDERVGMFHQLINPGKEPSEVIRIRPRDVNRAGQIIEEADKFKRISKLARTGGVIASVVNIGVTGLEISTAGSNRERTVIVFENVGKALGGVAATAALAVAITPVGLVGFLVVVAASTVGSVVGEQIAGLIEKEVLYDTNGNRVDIWADRAWEMIPGFRK